MGQIENSISVYERLSTRKYKITVEDGTEFILQFDKMYYHHLVGFHYLTDITDIASPPHGKARFYRQLKNHRISEESILQSALFGFIADRVAYFEYIEEILSASDCKIIVEFDKSKAASDIDAKFFLYKRVGNPLNKEPITYYALFIGYDDEKKLFYPATYVVEHSRKYVSNQIMLNCKIELISRS